MESTSTFRMLNRYVKMETITFPDRTRRYRITMPHVTGPFGVSCDSLFMANKVAAMRIEDLKAVLK